MHRFAPVALATFLAATVPAQLCAQAPTPFTVPPAAGHFTDPANLAGERVRPRDGRELPIDGGLGANGQPNNSLGLAQLLRKLSTRASLMLIVAHPDDEDGGMLTYYSRGLGARVAILTLNRGEGGQNQMTGDFEDALGLIRTQELLSADRYMGVDTQMFGTEVDFGFSKTKSESFQKWNHERVLYDAVRAVRIFRPLVVASVFMGAVTDGHGQHQVSGQIAQEVFKAAGDPNVFPELTKEGILPWQPLKVYARVPFSRVTAQGLFDYATGQTVPAQFTNYVTGQTFTTEPTADVTIHEGQTDPLLSTCAANPADLPTYLSSRPEARSAAAPTTLSSRPEASRRDAVVERPLYSAQAAQDCHPLSYVQFARIGLGLQRTQIGAGMRVPSAGRFDVGYHLYGSRVCAPNLPNPTPNLCTSSSTTATNNHETGWPTLSHSERVGYRAPREKTPPPHAVLASFTPSRSDNPALANQPTFFDGIDTSIRGIGDLAPHASTDLIRGLGILMDLVDKVLEKPDQPERLAAPLADALTATERLIQQVQQSNLPTLEKENILHELKIKRAQLEQALTLSLGLSLDAATDRPDLALGGSEQVALTLSDTASQPLAVTFIGVNGDGDFQPPRTAPQLSPSHPLVRTWLINAPPEAPWMVTKPYFYRRSIEQPVYDLWNERFRNAPQTPAPFTANATVNYQGVTIRLERIVHSGSQPVSIIPPASISFDSHANVAPESVKSFKTTVHLENVRTTPISGTLTFAPPSGWSLRQQQISLTDVLPAKPVNSPIEIDSQGPIHAWGGPWNPAIYATLSISGDNRDHYTEGFRPVGYGTLPRTNFYTPATLRVVPVDLKLPPENKRRIAYLPGTGDDVPAALASIGLTPTILKVSDLTAANLAHFDTVILGVRTYNAHPDLHGAPTQALFDFARNGGNVVVQYQTNEFSAADAPYPLTLHGERVIDETAPVTLLEPEASRYPEASASGLSATSKEKGLQPLGYALLTTPNRITSADFNNWIEERGHGFLDTWDPHYTALTETHDPGSPSEHIADQAPQRGGLITTQLGKGRWTYCAFALYRQLPEAVPGAFRLFVNLLNP